MYLKHAKWELPHGFLIIFRLSRSSLYEEDTFYFQFFFFFSFHCQFQFSVPIFILKFPCRFSISIVNFKFQSQFSISNFNFNSLLYDLSIWPRITHHWILTIINHEPDPYYFLLARSTSHQPDRCYLRLVRSTYNTTVLLITSLTKM